MIRKITAAMFLFCVSIDINAESIPYIVGGLYCSYSHPAEYKYPIRQSTCEEQHVIQQQSGGDNVENVVWWSASSHVRTDLWKDKVWENGRPWWVLSFTDDAKINLEKAYMLGTFGMSWATYQHSYHGRGDSSLVSLKFDGASNLLYFYSWFINMPQKYINMSAYIVDKQNWHLFVDIIISIFLMFIEGLIAIISTVIGVFAGSIINPVDTLCAIPGAIWLAVETTITAASQYMLGVWRLATSGIIGLIISPFAIGFSFLPWAVLGKFFSKSSD
jgi:hypothetical protein